MDQPEFPVLKPSGQVDFHSRLQAVRNRYLHDAMKATIEAGTFDLRLLDDELASFSDPIQLKRLAAFHLRGEAFFAVPYLLNRNPFLLGYYRLLYGFSGKAFYGQGPFKRFERLESAGVIDARIAPQVPALCRSLCATAALLVERIDPLSLAAINDLQVLTLGAQFGGSRNVKVGRDATERFLALLNVLLLPYDPEVKGRRLTFVNDSKLTVALYFGADPDVGISQQLGTEERKLVAIELKGGTDISNIWNRLGEAEKSHLKAKSKGYNELWTVARVDLTADPILLSKAKSQSPSTTRFFCLDRIADATTSEAIAFRQVLGALMGVRLAP